MYTLGLTGSMGSGKSHAATIFEEFGIAGIDTDMISRQVTLPGTPCREELVQFFGSDIIAPSGALDRGKLATIAFSNKEITLLLNNITHKYIIAECRRWLNLREREGRFAVLVQAPLLYESRFNYDCDFVIAVLCDTETKIRRIRIRDGMTEQESRARLAGQHDDRYFYNRADYTLNNNDGKNIRLQVDLVIQQIKFV